MLHISVQVELRDGGEQLTKEGAGLVTAIIDSGKGDTAASAVLRPSAAPSESGNQDPIGKFANIMAEQPTEEVLRLAVRFFDNTKRTAVLWPLIKSSPFQRLAIELMNERLTGPDFIPDYDLLLNLTGMKMRLEHPLEFDAAESQPYPEHHPELEEAGVEYFRSLLETAVSWTAEVGTARAHAIAEIITTVAATERCPLGTYGLSSTKAAALATSLGK